MDRTTHTLAAYASGLSYAHLSPGAIHAAKRSLIDSIGCAFGAFHAGPVQALRKLAGLACATHPATVIGTNLRSTPELAAFANGAMVRYLDFSDDYFGGRGDVGPHPSDNICSVLAAAESAGADGRALLLGIIVAYETCAQFAAKIDFKGAKPTWDYTVLHAIAGMRIASCSPPNSRNRPKNPGVRKPSATSIARIGPDARHLCRPYRVHLFSVFPHALGLHPAARPCLFHRRDLASAGSEP